MPRALARGEVRSASRAGKLVQLDSGEPPMRVDRGAGRVGVARLTGVSEIVAEPVHQPPRSRSTQLPRVFPATLLRLVASKSRFPPPSQTPKNHFLADTEGDE